MITIIAADAAINDTITTATITSSTAATDIHTQKFERVRLYEQTSTIM